MAYSESVEEYLKVLSDLGAGESPTTMHDLAARLGVSAVSTHEMVKKLADQGLVQYEPYKGITLTPAGRRVAGQVVRGHRLWERFLRDVLDVPWTDVHQEAGRLEHAASPAVMDRLADFLDNPECCPHGHPIDEPGRLRDAQPTCALNSLVAGGRSVVVRVPEDDAALLAYIDQLGLHPEVEVEIVEVAPFGGPVIVRVAGERKVIGQSLASRIVVRAP